MHSIYTRNSTNSTPAFWDLSLTTASTQLMDISGVVTHSGLLQQLTQGMKQKYNNSC